MKHNPLIAVVDDDPGMCDAIAELLEVLDFESARFCCAEDFLAEVPQRQFDCLVSDVRMPGIDGYELGQRVAILVPKLPVIFVSSSELELARVRKLNMNSRAFLRKPLDVDQFKHQINTVVGRF